MKPSKTFAPPFWHDWKGSYSDRSERNGTFHVVLVSRITFKVFMILNPLLQKQNLINQNYVLLTWADEIFVLLTKAVTKYEGSNICNIFVDRPISTHISNIWKINLIFNIFVFFQQILEVLNSNFLELVLLMHIYWDKISKINKTSSFFWWFLVV